jgi:hypothetical protein
MLDSENASQPLVNVVTVAEPVSVTAVVDAVHKVSYPPLRARFVVRYQGPEAPYLAPRKQPPEPSYLTH